MNFTAHCQKRWKERIDPEGTLPIEEVFKEAVYVWRGANLNGKIADFYVNGDIIFTVSDQNVLTVYKADYGFGNGIDRDVSARLLEQLLQLNKDLDYESSKVEKECRELETEIHKTNDEIAVYQAQINHLNAKVNRIKEKIKELRRGVESLKTVRDCQARKLVFPVSWKIENIGNLGNWSSGGKGGKRNGKQ